MNIRSLVSASAAAALLSASPAMAQSVLVPTNHPWHYMHPTNGSLPLGSGATEPNSGATKWYAPEAQFAASYTGPSFTTGGLNYQAGTGPGPLGYDLIDTVVLGTTLTQPVAGLRYTA
jgi:hypothetical protein